MSQPSWIGYDLGGRYTIEEELGQGGMSAVYKANDPNLRRKVAIKLIHPHLSKDPEFVRRFEEEAAAVAQMSHPNIVQVFDFNHDDDTYYMVLEFVPGETLQDRLKRLNDSNRQLSMTEAVEAMAGMCDAVDYAHKRGMIHRDIKPANIMINTQGKPVLMDFGVVKILGGQQHTATGAVIGTALYMSPEQVRGERPDERADIYSLGVTLFEAVSGQPPYEADSAMTTMMMHLNDPVPDIRGLNADVPDGLKAIIEKALAKDPANRFQSAGEMSAALGQVLAGEDVVIEDAVQDEPDPGMQAATMLETTPPPAPVPGDAATMLEQPPAPPEVVIGADPAAAAIQATKSAQKTSAPAQEGGRSGLPTAAIIGGGAVLAIIAVIVVAVLVLPLGGGGEADGAGTGGESGEAEVQPVEEGDPGAAAVVPPTEEPLAPTEVPLPTDLPAPTEPPPPTEPAGPFVQINDIALNGNAYSVTYETFGYDPALPGTHIHFFFNSVTPDQAGVPGGGPWILYAGPIPFTQYTVADRPASATQMCALVANPDHSVQQATGNCVDLP